jgi:Rap1a immunity proteins
MRMRSTRTTIRYAVLLSMGLLFASGEIFAEDPLSANSNIVGCRNYVANSTEELFLQGYCAGAIQALIEFAAGACAPKAATATQAARIVIQYIDARRTRLHESFNKLAAEALRSTWPCTN